MSVEIVTEELAKVSISPYILPPGDSTQDLPEEDAKVSHLLELLDEYEKLANDHMRIDYVNGFQDLSRANYNGTRKYGVDSFDLRPYLACTIVEHDGEWSLVDRFAEQTKKEKERKEQMKREKEEREKKNKEEKGVKEESEENRSTDEVDNNFEEKVAESQAESQSISISTSSGQLRNRKDRSKETKLDTSKATKFSKNESKPSALPPKLLPYRNPINQFGGLVPYQLRSAQDHFKNALADSVRLANLQQRISALIKEIET